MGIRDVTADPKVAASLCGKQADCSDGQLGQCQPVLGEHVTSLSSTLTLPLVTSSALLTLKLSWRVPEAALAVGEQEGICVSQHTPGAV